MSSPSPDPPPVPSADPAHGSRVRGWIEAAGAFAIRHRVATLAGSVAGAYLLDRQFHEIFASALWFPPSWRRYSIFLLLTVGTVTYFLVRQRIQLREDAAAAAPERSGAHGLEAQRKTVQARAWIGVFVVSSFAYVMLKTTCVVDIPSPSGSPASESSVAAAGAATDGDGFYLPIVLPDELAEYARQEHGLREVIGKNPDGIRDCLDIDHPVLMGLTTLSFLTAYLGIIVSTAALFAVKFHPVKAVTKKAAESILD